MDEIDAIIARIKDQVPQLRQVEGAIELDAVINGTTIASPAAFVVPLADVPQKDEGFTGRSMQLVIGTFAVLFVIDNQRSASGAAVVADLKALRAGVRKALLGWVPDEQGGEPVWAGKGQLIDFINGRTWWADEFHLNHYWSEQ